MPQILLSDRPRCCTRQKGASDEATIAKVLRGLTYILRQVSQMTGLPKNPTKQVANFVKLWVMHAFFFSYTEAMLKLIVQIHKHSSIRTPQPI